MVLLSNAARADLTTVIGYGNGNDGGGVAFTNPAPGAYTLTASGSDIWSTSDHGGFLYDPAQVTGDFTAIVRVTGYSGDPLAGEWGRTGIMARANGAAANSANIFAVRKSGHLNANAIAGVLQYRDANGGGTDRQGGEFPGTPHLAGLSGNDVWLALSRNGDNWVMRHALGDGTNNVPANWSMGRGHWSANLGGSVPVHVGLAHQAHSLPRRNTAHFEAYSIGALDPQLGSPLSGLVNYVQQPNGTWNRIEMYTPNRTYADALAIAATLTHNGAPGHLATPRSLLENFTMNGLQYAGNGANWERSWIGLNDIAVEGDWALVDDGQVIWRGLGSGAGGAPVGGAFTQWNGTVEPNNAGALGEHAAEMLSGSALWNDLPTTGTMRSSIIEFQTALPSKPELPGPNGQRGTFGVRMFRGTNYNFNNVMGVEALAYGVGENPGLVRQVIDSQQPMINFQNDNNDPFFPGSVPFPGIPQVTDNFALLAKGTILIEEEDDYTFAFRSDDGALLRIHGATFFDSATPAHNWSNRNGGKAHLGNLAMFSSPTGDSNTKAVAHLLPGEYKIEFMSFDNGGGGHAELLAARGNRLTEDTNGSPHFRPIGHQATPTLVPGVTGAGWQVWTSPPGGPVLNSLADANAELNAHIAGGAPAVVHNSVNFNDPGFGGPGRIGGDIPFDGNTAGDDDDFALYATATLVIPADGVYRFGFQGDDGGEFGFFDTSVSFNGLLENATGAARIDGGFSTGYNAGLRNALVCDCLTGNSSTVGDVFLAAGNYQIYAGFWERGGGAYFEVFGGGPSGPLVLLSANGAGITPDIDGLQLVPEPSSLVLAGIGLLGLAALRRRRRG